MTHTHKRITYDNNHITGEHNKRWQFCGDDIVEMVSPEEWSASPLPDTTKRDAFGGIIAKYNN